MFKPTVSIPNGVPPPESISTPIESLPVLNILKSEKFSERLDQIDELRRAGVGSHISLPQLVVCGDQSVGKSAVLTGLTGIPFPQQDELCTRFATEIIIRHDPKRNHVSASFIPSDARTDAEKQKFEAARKDHLVSFEDLPSIIEEATTLFGVRTKNNNTAGLPAFASDILRLEIIGKTGLHLTIVDLPGLIRVTDSTSDNKEDLGMVRSLVNSYMSNPRTINLAVIQATSDIKTQEIIQIARDHDKLGVRTVGIVTKPDLVNPGSEHKVVDLSHNNDPTKLDLGYFVLRNPSPKELLTTKSPEQREKIEQDFLNDERWRDQALNTDRFGVSKLRAFCQDLLQRHIEEELPKVTDEIRKLQDQNEHKLKLLGKERSTIQHFRTYLSKIYTDFNSVAKDASNGRYYDDNVDFFQLKNKSDVTLLRAKTCELNDEFAKMMHRQGARRYLYDPVDKQSSDSRLRDLYTPKEMPVTKEDFLEWVKEKYLKLKGRELPGTANPDIVWILFQKQSKRWKAMSKSHLDTVITQVSKFATAALSHVVKDEKVRQKLQRIMIEQLQSNEKAAKDELAQLLDDELGQPFTYNPHYVENLERARGQDVRAALQLSWTQSFEPDKDQLNIEKLGLELQKQFGENMTDYTCAQIASALTSYYKVALTMFIDNVCRQVIERHILKGLIKVLDSTQVSNYDDKFLEEVASESPVTKARRNELKQLGDSLSESLKKLQIQVVSSKA